MPDNNIQSIPDKVYIFNTAKRDILPASAAIPLEAKNALTQYGCVIPPIDRAFLPMLEALDPTHKSSIDVKSIATSQKGYKCSSNNRKLNTFLHKPNYDSFKTFQDIVDAFTYEFYVYDEAYLELIRIADRVSIFNTPVRYVYVKVNKQGRIDKYCYVTDDGEVVEFEPYNGGELKNGVRYLVGMRNYNTASYFYGYPAYMSALEAMLENSYIRRYGTTFFNNNATPDKALILKGTLMSKENKESIKNYMTDNYKGIDNAHRLLIITLDDEGSEADFVDISSSFNSSFLEEYRKNRDEIITVHQIPPKLMGITVASGLSTGTETLGSLRDFVERTIAPRQNKISNFFSTLLSEIFALDVKFSLLHVDTTNDKDEAIINNIYANIVDDEGKPVKTVTEIRAEKGYPVKPEGALHRNNNKKAPNAGSVPGQNTYEHPNDIDSARGR